MYEWPRLDCDEMRQAHENSTKMEKLFSMWNERSLRCWVACEIQNFHFLSFSKFHLAFLKLYKLLNVSQKAFKDWVCDFPQWFPHWFSSIMREDWCFVSTVSTAWALQKLTLNQRSCEKKYINAKVYWKCKQNVSYSSNKYYFCITQ